MQTGLAKIDQEWVPLQAKVFTRWVVAHLHGQSTVDVRDITTDLKDGVALVELAEILTGKKSTESWSKKPKSPYAQTQNCDLALKIFQQDGVQFVGMSGKDIKDGNKKLTLGLIWTLILKYSIGTALQGTNNTSGSSSASSSTGSALKAWAIDRVKGYNYINGFQPYDMSICALLDSYYPDEMNYKSINPENPQENLLSACKVMHHHDIDILVYPEDLEDNEIDDKTLLTQLSAIKSVVSKINESQIKSRSATIQTNQTSTTRRTVTKVTSSSSNQTSSSSQQISTSSQQTSSSSQKNSNLGPVRERGINLDLTSDSTDVNGDNSQYEGRRFALTMTLPASEYNQLQTDASKRVNDAQSVQLALTLVYPDQHYLNPAGLMLDLTDPNFEYDRFQQFTFGKDEWNTVIDSFAQKGMVWDVANQHDLNPPEGTEFYLFPFHGRHNQRFVFQNGHIYAKQNGQVVTYNGGDKPLVMRKQSNELNARQTFQIHLL